MLKLDNKYFIPFIGILGIIGTLAIFVFSVEYADSRTKIFREKAEALDWTAISFISASGDSISLESFRDEALEILFLAAWSQKSLDAAKELQRISKLRRLLLVVKDSTEQFAADYPFSEVSIVDGTRLYQDLKVTGVPSLIRFSPGLEIDTVVIGFHGADDYRFIRKQP